MKPFYLPVLICCWSIPISAQSLYINGATFKVASGATVTVKGNLGNQSTSNYINDGTVTVTGVLTNNQAMASPASGTLTFNGTARQTIQGSAPLLAKNVQVSNAQGVALNTVLKIDGECRFSSGIISARSTAAPVVFTSNGSVSSTATPSGTSHIYGYVVKEGIGTFTYPVGDSTHYQPVGTGLKINSAGMRVRYDTTNAGTAPFTANGTDATPLLAYNSREYWDLSPLGTANGAILVSWDNTRNVGITDMADLKVAHKSSGEWWNEGGTATGTIAAGTVRSNDVSTWSPFTLGSISAGSPLPLVWMQLSGSINAAQQAVIRWRSIEKNTAYYELLKSNDGKDFNLAGLVIAHEPGNETQEYSYTDLQANATTTYYRLRQTDQQGQARYSETIKLSGQAMAVAVFPNPVHDLLTIHTGNNGALLNSRVYLTDLSGKTVAQAIAGSAVFTMDLGMLPSGRYLLHFPGGQTFPVSRQ